MLDRIKTISEELKKKGYVLEIYPTNQVENGNASLVESGAMPLVTYTATIFDKDFYDAVGAFSFDTFSEAIAWAVSWCENRLPSL